MKFVHPQTPFNSFVLTLLLGIAIGSTLAKLVPAHLMQEILPLSRLGTRVLAAVVLSGVVTAALLMFRSDYLDICEDTANDLPSTPYTRFINRCGLLLEDATIRTTMLAIAITLNPVWHVFGLWLATWPVVTALAVIGVAACVGMVLRLLWGYVINRWIFSREPA